MKEVASIIINRNLPEVTDKLYEHLIRYDGDITDVYVIESGSDEDKLSQYCTWWANWDESVSQGLRTPRGFNFALSKLWEEQKFSRYNYFFLMPNDAEFKHESVVTKLVEEMNDHPRVGILAPCSSAWGEYKLLGNGSTKYFWHIGPGPWFLRRQYIEDIMELENPNYMNFLYDGTNFRGYESDIELIVKGYANDWASAITTKVISEENQEHLRKKADLIKTDLYEDNIVKYFEEGKKWMRRKYGFNNRWSMQMYSKYFYEKFFELFPEYKDHRI